MRYPLDELIDKRSIIKLKIERIPDIDSKPLLHKEFQDYSQAIKEYIDEGVCNNVQVEDWSNRLYDSNSNIWNLEAAIRQGKEGELGLEEVGRRAIEIRNNNGKRIKIKSEIVEKVGIGYKDIKINHASEL